MPMRSLWTAASVAVILVGMLLVIAFSEDGLLDLSRLRQARDERMDRNRVIVRENANLMREIERLKHDPRYIESIARQELGVIGKNEVILRFKPSGERE